jgi:hypothetical protein
MSMGKLQVGIARRDHFSLFREAEPPINTTWRLGANPAIGRPPAARDRSAAPMEDRQRNLVL